MSCRWEIIFVEDSSFSGTLVFVIMRLRMPLPHWICLLDGLCVKSAEKLRQSFPSTTVKDFTRCVQVFHGNFFQNFLKKTCVDFKDILSYPSCDNSFCWKQFLPCGLAIISFSKKFLSKCGKLLPSLADLDLTAAESCFFSAPKLFHHLTVHVKELVQVVALVLQISAFLWFKHSSSEVTTCFILKQTFKQKCRLEHKSRLIRQHAVPPARVRVWGCAFPQKKVLVLRCAPAAYVVLPQCPLGFSV